MWYQPDAGSSHEFAGSHEVLHHCSNSGGIPLKVGSHRWADCSAQMLGTPRCPYLDLKGSYATLKRATSQGWPMCGSFLAPVDPIHIGELKMRLSHFAVKSDQCGPVTNTSTGLTC